MALVTTEQAVAHLRITYGEEHEKDLALKIAVAESHVLTYLKRTGPLGSPEEDWTIDSTDTEFYIVQGAILEVLANIYFDRGDRDNPSVGPITPRIKNSLSMLRDPALA